MEVNEAQAIYDAARDQVATIVVGKSMPITLTFTALLAGGHVLFEDIPGVGKTTLVQAMAKTLAVPFSRIQ
ncbi:MAG: AAA family ATPase, partial [Lacticaseibacillus paracasei]|nr:AAA family ATPase [Lacticaseibacillus paracasei]